jgi:hypothetical protein
VIVAKIPVVAGRRSARRSERISPAIRPGRTTPAEAQKDADGSPVSNGARNVWVTETALSTALYTSFLAEGTALFAIVVGIA